MNTIKLFWVTTIIFNGLYEKSQANIQMIEKQEAKFAYDFLKFYKNKHACLIRSGKWFFFTISALYM